MAIRGDLPPLERLTDALNQACRESQQALEHAFRKRAPANDSVAGKISHFFTNRFNEEMRAAKDEAMHKLRRGMMEHSHCQVLTHEAWTAVDSLVRHKFDELEQEWLQTNVFAPDANKTLVETVDAGLQEVETKRGFQSSFNYLKPKNDHIFSRIASFFFKIFHPRARLLYRLAVEKIAYAASKRLGLSERDDTGLCARIKTIAAKRFDQLLAEKDFLEAYQQWVVEKAEAFAPAVDLLIVYRGETREYLSPLQRAIASGNYEAAFQSYREEFIRWSVGVGEVQFRSSPQLEAKLRERFNAWVEIHQLRPYFDEQVRIQLQDRTENEMETLATGIMDRRGPSGFLARDPTPFDKTYKSYEQTIIEIINYDQDFQEYIAQHRHVFRSIGRAPDWKSSPAFKAKVKQFFDQISSSAP